MGQFLKFRDDEGYPAAEKPGESGDLDRFNELTSPNMPVHAVNWFDAVLYCNWLSAAEGIRPAYQRTGEKWKWIDYQGHQREADA